MNDSITKPNRYSHPGVAGRKPKPSTLVARALKNVDKRLPEIFNALIQKALEGDREAQIYLIDRRLGKPKVEMDTRVTGFLITADDYELACRLAKTDETKLLAGGSEQGESEGAEYNGSVTKEVDNAIQRESDEVPTPKREEKR